MAFRRFRGAGRAATACGFPRKRKRLPLPLPCTDEIGKHSAHALEHREIGTAAEGVLARSHDRALDGSIPGNFINQSAQLLDDARVDDVHRALGHIPGDQRNAVGINIKFEIGHRCSP